MDFIISQLSRRNLLVNYFSLFALSLIFNISYVYLPFSIFLPCEQIIKFLMMFAVAVYVTNNRRVLTLSFWGLISVAVIYIVAGFLQHYDKSLNTSAINLGISLVTSFIALAILLLLWSNALRDMKGIIGSLTLLTVYRGMIALPLSSITTSLSGDVVWGNLIAFSFLPFLVMMFFFFFVIRDGRKAWNER